MCREKGVEALVDGNDVISMIDRDFEVLREQYKIRSTKCLKWQVMRAYEVITKIDKNNSILSEYAKI